MFNALIVAVTATDRERPTRVAASLAARLGLPVETLSVDEDCDIAATIVEHVRARDGALLVMTTGGAFLLSQARRSVTKDVLERLCQPVLLLGPRCAPGRLAGPALVVAVDHEREAPPAVPVVNAWLQAFGGRGPLWIDVVAVSTWPPGSADDTECGDVTVLRTNDPVTAVLRFGEAVDDAVFILTSERWAGGRSHWYSTTRRVVQESSRPVLVVPADLPVSPPRIAGSPG